MEKEKINYIREYYKFGNEFPDLEIEKELGDSLGAACFDIKKAKIQLAKSVIDCFPKLRNETQKIKFTKSKTAFRNINGKDVSDDEWKEKLNIPTWQDQPVTDGFYWFLDDTNDLKIVEVYWSDNEILGAQVAFHGSDDDSDLINITGKWYGPITPPKECNP